MNGLKQVLDSFGFKTENNKIDFIQLLFLAGCFNQDQHLHKKPKQNYDQLHEDLKASGFSSDECVEVCRLRDANATWEQFISAFNKYLVNVENNSEKLKQVRKWLNIATTRAFLTPINTAWMQQHDATVRKITTNIKHVDLLNSKNEYLTELNKNKKEAELFSIVIIPGGSIPKIIDRTHTLQLLMTENSPISLHAYYIPTNRELTYDVDTETAVKFNTITTGTEMQTEKEFIETITFDVKERISERLSNRQKAIRNVNPGMPKPSAPPSNEANPELYEKLDDNIALPNPEPNNVNLFAEKFRLDIHDPMNHADFSDVMNTFAKYHRATERERLNSVLIISSAEDILKHTEIATTVFGSSVSVKAIAAPAVPAEIMRSIGERIKAHTQNEFLNEAVENKTEATSSTRGFTVAAGLFGVAAFAAVATFSPSTISNVAGVIGLNKK